MRANTSSGGGNAKKKKTLYGKMVPTTSVGGGRTKMPTKKQAAATRSMIGNAALMVVPGGAAIKGARAVSGLAKSAKEIGTVKGAVYAKRANALDKKRDKLDVAEGKISSRLDRMSARGSARTSQGAKTAKFKRLEKKSVRVGNKYDTVADKAARARGEVWDQKLIGDAKRLTKIIAKGSAKNAKAYKKVSASNYKKLKSSGAIKRMK
jgi:hypothetical protein